MDIGSLRNFITLESAGSFNKAAKELFITQQGLNKSVAQMEVEVGCRLVVRTKRGVALTEEGELFLVYAKKICAQYDDMLAAMKARCSQKANSLSRFNIFVTPYITHLRMLGFGLKSSQLQNANIVEMQLDHIYEIMPHVGNDSLFLVDLFPDTMTAVEQNDDFSFEPLFYTKMGIAASEGYFGKDVSFVTLQELATLPLAYSQDYALDGMVKRIFGGEELGNVRLSSINTEMLIEWTMLGRGVCLFDSYAHYIQQGTAEGRARNLVFIPLKNAPLHAIGFLAPRSKPITDEQRSYVSNFKRTFSARNADYLRRHPNLHRLS